MRRFGVTRTPCSFFFSSLSFSFFASKVENFRRPANELNRRSGGNKINKYRRERSNLRGESQTDVIPWINADRAYREPPRVKSRFILISSLRCVPAAKNFPRSGFSAGSDRSVVSATAVSKRNGKYIFRSRASIISIIHLSAIRRQSKIYISSEFIIIILPNDNPLKGCRFARL